MSFLLHTFLKVIVLPRFSVFCVSACVWLHEAWEQSQKYHNTGGDIRERGPATGPLCRSSLISTLPRRDKGPLNHRKREQSKRRSTFQEKQRAAETQHDPGTLLRLNIWFLLSQKAKRGVRRKTLQGRIKWLKSQIVLDISPLILGKSKGRTCQRCVWITIDCNYNFHTVPLTDIFFTLKSVGSPSPQNTPAGPHRFSLIHLLSFWTQGNK